MSTVTFINAKLFIGGYNFSADFNQIAINWSVESLDETTFGATSRKHKGGLDDASITGAGFWESGVADSPDPVLYDALGLDDTLIVLFPDTITEGSSSTGAGYAFKAVQTRMNIGSAVGEILPFDFEAQGRGIRL